MDLKLEPQVPGNGLPTTWSLLESVAKVTAVLAIGCYAMGYLIVVLNDDAHGFLETSLLKPRAIVAGAIFVLLTLLPLSVTQNTFFSKTCDIERPLEMLARWLLGLVDYVAACFLVALMMLLIFTDDLHGGYLPRGRGYAFLALMWVVFANSIIRFAAVKFYRQKPVAWLLFSLACLAGLAVGLYNLRGLTFMRDLAWMFGVTAVVNPYLADIRRGLKLRLNAPVLVGVLLAVISLYSHFIFPYIKATWGGGSPVSTTIYLSKDYPVNPNQKLKADLLEVSESGFYVIFDGDKNATYIPKVSVAAMEFPGPAGTK